MVGSRTKIALLTLFFTFAFALSFFALMQNYANAGTSDFLSVRVVPVVVDTSDVQPMIEHEIIPSF